ncbi:MAG: class I SAM-dependent methyltransferase [Anaerolineales bacterium]|nr:class I SAM-dependent methyltransferase [Anaerolineales bacterium]
MQIAYENDESALEEILANLTTGWILDVAAGAGGFLSWMLEAIGKVAAAVAIDSQQRALAALEESQMDARIRPAQMDACRLAFPEGKFDCVGVSQSLHHLPEPDRALSEMRRVLTPGGMLLAREMYADCRAEAQRTHVALHHWWAAIDTARGIPHRETYIRDDLAAIFLAIDLSSVRLFDFAEPEGDPFDREVKFQIDEIIDRYQGFANQLDGSEGFHAEGERLGERLERFGFQGAPQLIMLGRI